MMRLLAAIVFCGFFFNLSFAAPPKGRETGVSFDKALPEDISNENFPDRIDSFNFPKANLLDLVKAIGKLTGMNFILDPNLNNKQISIIASSPITVAEAYKAFLSALSANNYSVVKSGAFWKVQSVEKIHKDNTEVYSGDYFPSTDQLITRIIKLKHINAKDFEASIKQLLSDGKAVSTHESSNSIIISDYGAVLERIMKIVNEMDVPGSEENIGIIQIEHASAEELAVILKELVSLNSSSSYSNRSSFSSKKKALSPYFKRNSKKQIQFKISSIIPDMRTNSLIVRADSKGFRRIQELVGKLDTRVDLSRTGGVWVYSVLYGTAEEVYNTLMGIKPPQRDSSSRRGRFYIQPKSRSSSSKNSSESPLFKDVRILADHNTNSLIISARSKYGYARVLNVLKKIDVPRDQVFIQAIILEMAVGKGNNTGFNLVGALSSLIGKSFDEGSIFRKIGESAIAGFLSDALSVETLQKSNLGPGLVLGMPFLKLLEGVVDTGSFNRESAASLYPPDFDKLSENRQDSIIASVINAGIKQQQPNTLQQTLSTAFVPLIRLLRKSDNINVLSTPQITTLDNVSAFIEVGENAPVGLKSTATVSGFSQSIDRKDVTLRLEITPLINPESGTIQMAIKQKFDDFSERSSSATELDSRAISVVKRNIETQMILHDGETAVLGGLLSDKKVTNYNKVPLLGDIPFIGWLFRGSDTKIEKRNLLVFITPTIISGTEQQKQGREILEKKLEDRILFIEEYMKGQDPHEGILGNLIPSSVRIKNRFIETEEVEDSLSVKKKSWESDLRKTEDQVLDEDIDSLIENDANQKIDSFEEDDSELFQEDNIKADGLEQEEWSELKKDSFEEENKDQQKHDLLLDVPPAVSGPELESFKEDESILNNLEELEYDDESAEENSEEDKSAEENSENEEYDE